VVAHLVGFSDSGEEALLTAALQPARALSVLTWGATSSGVTPCRLGLPLGRRLTPRHLITAYDPAWLAHPISTACSWSAPGISARRPPT
jgi:hypothetical protein